MIKEFFNNIKEGFYNWCNNAGDWLVGKHDVPVIGGVLLWFGDKLKKAHQHHEDMKATDATEFFINDDGEISFDGDPVDVNDTTGVDFDEDDVEFEEDEAPVEEKPEEEPKKTPKFQRDHSTWFTDVKDSIQAFFWDIGSKIHDFFKGIKNFFKPVNYYEVYGSINVA